MQILKMVVEFKVIWQPWSEKIANLIIKRSTTSFTLMCTFVKANQGCSRLTGPGLPFFWPDQRRKYFWHPKFSSGEKGQIKVGPLTFQKGDYILTVRNDWVFTIQDDLTDARSAVTTKPSLTHLYHIWVLSNEVLYDPTPEGVSKIRQVKVEKPKFT